MNRWWSCVLILGLLWDRPSAAGPRMSPSPMSSRRCMMRCWEQLKSAPVLQQESAGHGERSTQGEAGGSTKTARCGQRFPGPASAGRGGICREDVFAINYAAWQEFIKASPELELRWKTYMEGETRLLSAAGRDGADQPAVVFAGMI